MADISIEIKIDQVSFEEAKRHLNGIKKGIEKTMMRAINKTLGGVRKDMSDAISSQSTAPVAAIKGSINFTKARLSNISGKVTFRGKTLNPIFFKARQTEQGVTYQAVRGGARDLIPHAFIASNYKLQFYGVEMKFKSDALVMIRKKLLGRRWRTNLKYSGLPKKYRLPIMPAPGISLINIFTEKPELWGQILAKANARLNKNFEHEAEFLVIQAKAGDA